MDLRRLVLPAVSVPVLFAGYLLLRPYGDFSDPAGPQAAAAYLSWRWVAAHLLGILGLLSFARILVRTHDLVGGGATAVARTLGLAGAGLTVSYYGAETFALPALAASGDLSVLALEGQVRYHPAALTLFGLGLLLLAAAAALRAHALSRTGALSPAWAAWPLAVLIIGLLPQFFLPPVGRMLYGAAFVLAGVALWYALAGVRSSSSAANAQPVGR